MRRGCILEGILDLMLKDVNGIGGAEAAALNVPEHQCG